mgnify:CR=1 FL=1
MAHGSDGGAHSSPRTAALATLRFSPAMDSVGASCFGQRSVLSFSKVEVNPALAKDAFQFSTPKGADVIRQ